MRKLASDVKMDGFPLSNIISSSSLVVTLPAKAKKQAMMMSKYDLWIFSVFLLYIGVYIYPAPFYFSENCEMYDYECPTRE